MSEYAVFKCQVSLKSKNIFNGKSQTRVFLIPKAGKRDKTAPKSFRPISLTSTMLKVMEKIIDEHIKSKFLRTKPLSRYQFAYQQNKSTVTALHELVSKLEKNVSAKELALAAFLDIEEAFDNVSYKSIQNNMLKRGFEHCIKRWVMAMLRLTERSTFCLKFD